MITVGSLFAGIGGFELGLEWTGAFRTVWQVERDPYCLRVLEKHWPDALRFDDVCMVGAHNLPPVDLICGGFPCQDISVAGKRVGIDGERSGLWREFARIVREVRPRYVLVENVAALLGRGLGRVLGDLAASGYDAEWSVLSAANVGAPHLRERLFVIATPSRVPDTQRDGVRLERKWSGQQRCQPWTPFARDDGEDSALAHADGYGEQQPEGLECYERGWTRDGGEAREVAHAACGGLAMCGGASREPRQPAFGCEALADASGSGLEGRDRPEATRAAHGLATRCCSAHGGSQWAVEPDVGRVVNGLPARVDRVRALGNAIVPQCAEFVGRRLLEMINERNLPATREGEG